MRARLAEEEVDRAPASRREAELQVGKHAVRAAQVRVGDEVIKLPEFKLRLHGVNTLVPPRPEVRLPARTMQHSHQPGRQQGDTGLLKQLYARHACAPHRNSGGGRHASSTRRSAMCTMPAGGGAAPARHAAVGSAQAREPGAPARAAPRAALRRGCVRHRACLSTAAPSAKGIQQRPSGPKSSGDGARDVLRAGPPSVALPELAPWFVEYSSEFLRMTGWGEHYMIDHPVAGEGPWQGCHTRHLQRHPQS